MSFGPITLIQELFANYPFALRLTQDRFDRHLWPDISPDKSETATRKNDPFGPAQRLWEQSIFGDFLYKLIKGQDVHAFISAQFFS